MIDDDDDPADLAWSIGGLTDGTYNVDDGMLTGTSGDDSEILTIIVTDDDPNPDTLTFSVNIEVA